MSQSAPTIGTSIHRLGRNACVKTLMLIYLVSGACSLMDEVVWVRLLKLIIGNTVYASSIVVSVFMGGLALGAFVMGRYSDRVRKPLRLYALMELAITISALSLPWVFKGADVFYVWFWRATQVDHASLIVIQTILSALILLVPTLLMGGTLPLLGRVVASVETQAGQRIGWLYALNVLGAAMGCFGAGFILLRLVGVMATLWIAAALNLCVALMGYVLHRLWPERVGPVEAAPMPPAAPVLRDRSLVFLGLGFFASGFISIGYELLWMRSIVHSIGAFTYVFSAVLTLYLLGNVLGTALGASLLKRLRNCGATYAALLFALGLTGVLYLPWLYLCSYHLFPSVLDSLEASSWTRVVPWRMLSPLIKGAFLFLVPSTIMGIGMPIMLQAWVDRSRHIGRSTGTAYCVNTLGAVTGGLVTGFVLIPMLGVQRATTSLGLAAMWIAAAIWFYHLRASKQSLARRLVPALAAILISINVGNAPGGLYARIVALNQFVQGCDVVDYEEGRNTIVSLHKNRDTGSTYLCTSGRMVAGTDHYYRGDQKMLGHFPLLLFSQAQKALSVGFGSGESTACLSKHRIEQVDCVEIAPEVVAFSKKHFSHINLGDRADKDVRIIYMDARNYLHLTENRYDVIINDCTSVRGFAENGSLFTKEYFEDARDCLSDRGCFMSWIDVYHSESPVVLNSIIGTMMEVFPHVTLWYLTPEPGPFFLIAGSKEPQMFSIAHINRELDKEGVRESLAEIHCHRSEDIMSCYVADETDLKRYVKRYATNSDFFPFVEFCPKDRFSGGLVSSLHFFRTVQSQSLYKHVDWTSLAPQAKQRWLAQFDKTHQAGNCMIQIVHSIDKLERLRLAIEGLETFPEYEPLIGVRNTCRLALFEAGMKYIAADQDQNALDVARAFVNLEPEAAMSWMLLSQARGKMGKVDLALAAARRAVKMAPENLSAQYNLWSVLIASNEVALAAGRLNAAAQWVSTP